MNAPRILITAGPTREPIDPIRYLSNRSSGKMGFALAEAAVASGAEVTLIAGPVHLPRPEHVQFFSVETAQEMLDAVLSQLPHTDIFISAAAVADYRPKHIATQKIKKDSEDITLTLTRNPDILSIVTRQDNPPFTVGFAAETENLIPAAIQKLKDKQLDMIIANIVGHHIGINSDENAVTILSKNQDAITIPLASKQTIAQKIIPIILHAMALLHK